MNYLVIEIQTTGNVTAHIATAYDNQPQAESKFHQILAAAATSNVEVHSAVVLNEFGAIVQQGYYDHREPVVEEQPNE